MSNCMEDSLDLFSSSIFSTVCLIFEPKIFFLRCKAIRGLSTTKNSSLFASALLEIMLLMVVLNEIPGIFLSNEYLIISFCCLILSGLKCICLFNEGTDTAILFN